MWWVGKVDFDLIAALRRGRRNREALKLEPTELSGNKQHQEAGWPAPLAYACMVI